MRDRTGQKQYPKSRAHGFYLGKDEEKIARLANLEEIATLLGVRGASSVIQLLADLPPATAADFLRPFIGGE